MNSSNLFRRMMSMVLCIIMALSLVAMPISADENTGLEELFEEVIPVATAASGGETIYVIAGSDFQNHTTGSTNASEAYNKTNYNDFKNTERVIATERIMNEIKSNGIDPYGILFCGDYTGTTNMKENADGIHYMKIYAKSGIHQLKTLTARIFENSSQDNWVFVQGNHDTEIDVAEGLSKAGANDTDYYGVYVLHDEDYGWKQGWAALADKTQRAHADVKAIEKSAANMRKYFEDKLKDDNWNNKPIFIAAHIPLHYSSRTKYDQDARYAEKIFEVINEYGAKGLNIIYLFGHNHSQPYDTYLGGSAIYLSRGDSIFIADPENYEDVPNQYMLNFTYMNAGYMSTSEAINEDGEVCSMAVFAITGSQVEIKRYSHDGLLDLKLPGVVEEEIDRMLATKAQAEIEITYTVQPSGGSDMEITENRKTYGMAAEEWQSYVGERITTAVINPIANTGTGTQVTIPKYTIRFYQTDTFIEGRSYVIANYGDATCKWTDGHYALRLKEDGNIGRSTITIKKDENGRYYVTPWDGAERYSARERTRSTQWVWKSTGQNATYTESSEQIGKLVASVPMGNLQALTTGQYLRVFGNNDDKLNLGTHTDPTTENPNPTVYGLGVSDTLADSNRALWGFDTSKRHKDGSGYKYEGKNFGLFVLTNAAGDKLRNDGYYITRNSATDTTWGIRLYKHADNTSQGPTYIFERDNTIPDGSDTYLVTGVDSQMHLVTGQYGSWERLKMDLLTKLSVKKNGKQYTDFTVTSDFVPNEAGEYIVYITCDGQTIGTIRLYVQQASLQTLKSTTLVPAYGYVFQNAAGTVATDASLRLTFTEGAQIDVPITVDMLTDANGNKVSTAELGTLENLIVNYYKRTDGTYGIQVEGFTLYVVDQNMPVYPNPGSTRVDKVGTGVDFQNTGAAQIELSATGVPLVEGFDVIVMVDTSTSMAEHDEVSAAGKEEYDTNQDGNLSRIERTREAVNVLIDTLKSDVNSGTISDVQIAIAHFNGYRVVNTQAGETYEPEDYYACDTDCYDHAYASQKGETGLPFSEDPSVDHGAITGVDDSMDLSHRAFVDATKLSANGLKWADETTLPMYSGTNYDFAFDAIYQLGHNIQKHNEEQGKGERELIVVFLSDGMPFQYNYYMGNAWRYSTESWATGNFPSTTKDQLVNGYKDKVKPNFKDYIGDSKYAHFFNEDGKHWMAEAIKGDPDESYPIIRKTTYGLEDVLKDLDTDGKTGKKYMGTLPGLGATLYTIGIGVHVDYNYTTAEGMQTVLRNLATDEDHFQNIMPEDDLALAFTSFIGDMKQAATGAYFLDTMGEAYDLYMSNAIALSSGATSSETPKIELVKYELKDGIRTGKFEILDSMTFGDNYLTTTEGTITVKGYDGKAVPGNTMGSVIKSGKYIWYNTAKSGDPESITDGKNTISLPPETFYCKLADGVLGEDFEYALRYYVYLTDALDDNEDNDAVPAGVYPTNKSATLNYINYLGNVCKKDTISPKLPWEAAQVSYAFYLVNDQGEIISDQKTGATTDKFSNRVAITRPVVYDTIDLNTSEDLTSQILAKDVLPTGYGLFVDDVDYSVTVNSGEGGGSWTITSADTKKTTYVTGFNGNDYSNEVNSIDEYDYSNTTVWFAVVANIGCVPDTVVVDFGLPVNIDVMSNDLMIGTNGTLKGIGKNKPDNLEPKDASNQTLESGFSSNLKKGTDGLTYGDARIENNNVVYSLNTMEMDDAEVFYYGLQYSGNVGAQGYYYGEVTVIPATIIYYEDSFLTYEAYRMKDNKKLTKTSTVWKSNENDAENQSQDRPGEFNLPDLDADNIYGYDPAYKNMHTYSMAGNHVATVNSTYYGLAKFDFTGTGFDVVSACSKATGILMVSVYEKEAFADAEGKTTAQKMQNATPVDVQMVDTYWGYTLDENGNWVIPTTDLPAATYQIPVIKMDLEKYDNYTAVITASYMPAFDHYGEADYVLYIDAIRIYDPANDGANKDVVQDAYVADGEGWPEYHELRNLILKAGTFSQLKDNKYSNGIVYIDGNKTLSDDSTSNVKPDANKTPAISDYYHFGPNNELYLGKSQGISFDLPVDDNIAGIHIAVKKLQKNNEKSASVTIYDAETSYGKATPLVINTATDLYYDITHLKGKTVVIYNSGSYAISITNIKFTHKSDPNSPENASYEPFTVTRRGAAMALKSLGGSLPEIQDPQATAVQKWNIVLGDDIGANFYVEAPENGAASAVKATVAGHTETYDLSALTPNEEGLYKISVNVAAAQMTEDITLQMVVDGTEYDPVSYSIQDYAKVILTGEYSDETKALVKHMLNYGAAAQNYFGVNKDNLANAGNEIAYTAQYPAEYPQLAVNGKIGGIRFYGASLVFESKVALRYYFEADSVEGVIFTVNGVSYPAVEKNGMFYVEIPNIAPYAYGDAFVLSAQKDGQTMEVSYSPMTYMVRMSQKGQENLKALMNAMYGYYEAAIAYMEQAN